MSEELPKIPTEDGKIHVLLTYVEGDPETYVHLFTSKKAVEDYVVAGIRDDYMAYRWHDDDNEDWHGHMEELMKEAVQCLREHGQWCDDGGNTYVYDEKEWTA